MAPSRLRSLPCVFLLAVLLFSSSSHGIAPGFEGFQSLLNGLSFSLHGHYCGLNHGDATFKTAPVDVVDAACMEHDRCYGKHYLDCRCDADFIDNLQQLKKTKLSKKTKSAAELMISWFESSPCKCKDDKGAVRELSGKITAKRKSTCHRPDEPARDEL